MTATVARIALLLARPHSLLLRGSDQGVDLLPFLAMDLLNLLPLLRYRKRRVRAYRCNLLASLLRNHAPLLQSGFGNSGDLPARFGPRRPHGRRGRSGRNWPNGNLSHSDCYQSTKKK
jgi:hypothetical protein